MTINPTNTTPESAAAVTYVYFVAFQFQSDAGTGFANMEFKTRTLIDGLAEVQSIERFLRSQGYFNAVVLGFTLFREETAQVGAAR